MIVMRILLKYLFILFLVSINITKCEVIIVPDIDSHYYVHKIADYNKFDFDFNLRSPIHKGSKRYNEETTEILFENIPPEITNIKCVFSNINKLNVETNLVIAHNLNRDVQIILNGEKIRLFGTFTRYDTMFCVLYHNNNLQSSFNTIYERQFHVIANRLTISYIPQTYFRINCDGKLVSSNDEIKLVCTNSVEIKAFMMIDSLSIEMESNTLRISNVRFLIQTNYPILSNQLESHVAYFSFFYSMEISHIKDFVEHRQQLDLYYLNSNSQVTSQPFIFDTGIFISKSQTVEYLFRISIAFIRVEWNFYNNDDECGRRDLFICKERYCIANLDDCAGFDPNLGTAQYVIPSTTISSSSTTTSSSTINLHENGRNSNGKKTMIIAIICSVVIFIMLICIVVFIKYKKIKRVKNKNVLMSDIDAAK